MLEESVGEEMKQTKQSQYKDIILIHNKINKM